MYYIREFPVHFVLGTRDLGDLKSMVEPKELVPQPETAIALSSLRGGILGIKAGMTQVYSKEGDKIPVTVIDLQQNVITQIKTKEKEGYSAVQVGVLPKKVQRATKPEKGHFKKAGFPGFYCVREFRIESGAESKDKLQEGVKLAASFVKEGELVDVTGESKGKGFQGGMKRYNMAGGFKTHGASVCHRSLGSIGNRADPGKCFKNKKMPGHMGSERVTAHNLKVVSIDLQNAVMLLKGSVPGSKNSIVIIRKAIKGVV